MSDQASRLSVYAMMDATSYTRGAKAVSDANKEMASGGKEVTVSLAAVEGGLTKAGGSVGRLTRAYDTAGAPVRKLQSDLNALRKDVESGAVSMDRAAVLYAGMTDKLGVFANGAHIASQGFSEFGTMISATNEKIREFVQVSAAIEMAGRDVELMTQKATALRAAIDPVGASQARLNAELAEYNSLLRAGAIGAQEFAAAENLARSRHDQLAASLSKTPLGGANDNMPDSGAQFRRQNLGYQGFDIAQGVASGMPLPMILAQQGPQIAQMYAGQGGLKAALSDVGGIAAGTARALGPIGIGLAAITAAAAAYFFTTRDGSAKAAEEFQKNVDLIRAGTTAWGDALPSLQAYVEQLDKAAKLKAGQEATSAIVGQSFGDLPAQMTALTAAFTKATQSLDQTPISADKYRELLSSFAALKKDGADNIVTMSDLDRVQKALGDSLASNSTPQLKKFADQFDAITVAIRTAREESTKAREDFLRSTAGGTNVQDIVGANTFTDNNGKTQYTRTFTPLVPPTPTVRPSYELEGDDTTNKAADKAATAYDQVINAAKQRMAQVQSEIALGGQAADIQAKLRVEYDLQAQYLEKIASIKGAKVDPAEVAAIKAKADAIANLNLQLAGQTHDQGLADTSAALQQQADMIGKSSEEQARSNAVFAENLKLRQEGLSLYGQEADARRQMAADQATALQAIQRQTAAYTSLQQEEGSVIDGLVTGTGSLKDRLKSVESSALQWVQQMALANPLKNAVFGAAFTLQFQELAP